MPVFQDSEYSNDWLVTDSHRLSSNPLIGFTRLTTNIPRSIVRCNAILVFSAIIKVISCGAYSGLGENISRNHIKKDSIRLFRRALPGTAPSNQQVVIQILCFLCSPYQVGGLCRCSAQDLVDVHRHWQHEQPKLE